VQAQFLFLIVGRETFSYLHSSKSDDKQMGHELLFSWYLNTKLKNYICFLSLCQHLHIRSLSTSAGMAGEMSSPEASQKNSKQSQRCNLSVNPDELANQVLVIDDPSQTLTSSLHAVDIPSFVDNQSGVTSPSPNEKAERQGMETSFTSPVLGMVM